MKNSLVMGLLLFFSLNTFAKSAVICGETVDTENIRVQDNYLGGIEYANKAFMDAIILEGTSLRTTLCDKNGNRFLIVKKAEQSSLDPRGSMVSVYPIPPANSQSAWH
jgi:hypothetical protein